MRETRCQLKINAESSRGRLRRDINVNMDTRNNTVAVCSVYYNFRIEVCLPLNQQFELLISASISYLIYGL